MVAAPLRLPRYPGRDSLDALLPPSLYTACNTRCTRRRTAGGDRSGRLWDSGDGKYSAPPATETKELIVLRAGLGTRCHMTRRIACVDLLEENF